MDPSWISVVLVLLLLGAAAHDSLRHKIPNYISLSGWIIAPALHYLVFGLDGSLNAVYGLGLTLLLTFPLYALRWMGAGDVKLMATVGAFVGVDSALIALAFIFVTGALFSIAVHVYRHSLAETITRLVAMSSISASMRKPVYVPPADDTAGLLIPYAVPIALGTFFFLAYVN